MDTSPLAPDGSRWVPIVIPPGVYVDVLSAALFLALGVFVGTIRPRRGANLAFAAFAILLGASFVVNNMGFLEGPGSDPQYWAFLLTGPLMTAAATALVVTALLFPRPLAAGDRGVLVVPGVVGAVVFATFAGTGWAYSDEILDLLGLPERFRPGLLSVNVGFGLLHGAFWFILMVLARRHLHMVDDDPPGARQIGFMACALVLYPGLYAGAALRDLVLVREMLSEATVWQELVTPMVTLPAAALVVTGLWLRNTTGPQARLSRNVALLTIGSACTGLVAAVLLPAHTPINESGMFGLARTTGVLLVGYAIARHQLLGIDLKLKWTISRGTLVGIFVAVFLVASVIAENYLTERFGLALGGVAAGLLLFGLTPLQRLADHVAERALPGVQNNPEYLTVRRLEVFRNAVASAAHDGRVTERERDVLAQLASDLGLSPKEARDVELGLAGRTRPAIKSTA